MGTAGITRLTGRILLTALALLALLAVLSARPANAAEPTLLGCGYEPVSPFLRFLDPLPYTLAPDGGFEAGAAGWTLSGGARVVSGNEPWLLGGAGDSKSLLLPAGSSATSPAMCVPLVLPIVRFFAQGGSFLSTLKVEAIYTDGSGAQRSIVLLPGVLASSGWQPTLPLLQLGGALNALTLNGLTSEMSFRFTPRAGFFGSGTWRIDDVYVDPWKNI
jgi:hypothetical protein